MQRKGYIFRLLFLLFLNAIFFIISGFVSTFVMVYGIKLTQFVMSTLILIAPSVIYLLVFDFNQLKKVVFNKIVILKPYYFIILLFVFITPLFSWLAEWNQTRDFSFIGNLKVFFDNLSQGYESVIIEMIHVDSFFDGVFTFFVVACVAAVGEELFFRAVLQRVLIGLFKNTWIGILITSFIFSVVHFDIYGIVPRFLISILLGFIYFKTNNLLLTIAWHLLNNGILLIFFWLGWVDAMQKEVILMKLPVIVQILILLASLGLSYFALKKIIVRKS